MFYRADPKTFITATPDNFVLVYYLVDGDFAGHYVLASGTRVGEKEQTCLYPCENQDGLNVLWEYPIATIPEIDDEGALNEIGYTSSLDKWVNK